jgi:hypothetical protein
MRQNLIDAAADHDIPAKKNLDAGQRRSPLPICAASSRRPPPSRSARIHARRTLEQIQDAEVRPDGAGNGIFDVNGPNRASWERGGPRVNALASLNCLDGDAFGVGGGDPADFLRALPGVAGSASMFHPRVSERGLALDRIPLSW